MGVERLFSQGRILLSHIRNRLSAQTARALMCLGAWSRADMVDDRDIGVVTAMPVPKEEDGDENGDILMPDGFDAM